MRMDIQREDIEQLFKLTGAAVSGGALWKVLDFVSGRRKRSIANEGALSKHALELVERLDKLNKQVQEELEVARKEREDCLKRSAELENEILDLRRWFRTMYEHMSDHMRKCEHPSEMPPLPNHLSE